MCTQLLHEQVVADTAATAALKEAYLQQECKLEDLQGTVAARGFQIQEFEEQVSEKKMKLEDTITAHGLQLHEMVEKVREKKAQQQEEVTSDSSSATEIEPEEGLKLRWAVEGLAPEDIRGQRAVVDGCMVYFLSLFKCIIHSYNSEKKVWSTLPGCPHRDCSLAIVNGLLTAIGGLFTTNQLKNVYGYTNTLLSLIVKDRKTDRVWCEQFHPMPTNRAGTAVICTEKALVVAGGRNASGITATVEVMDPKTLQWSIARSLPYSLHGASATVYGDCLYVIGGQNKIMKPFDSTSVLTCSLSNLLRSCQPQSLIARIKSAFSRREAVWQEVTDVPVSNTTCVTFNEQLLAVGGETESNGRYTNNIYALNLTTNSWEVTSHMPTARSQCLVTVLPGNKLMVAGDTDAVQIAEMI